MNVLANSAISFWLVSAVITFWLVYLQYYWFPQLQPTHFMIYNLLMAAGYATVNLVFHQSGGGVLGILPPIILLLAETLPLGRYQRQYIPAFLSVTILAYFTTEFMDILSISLLMALTNLTFVTSLWGIVTILLFNCVGLTILSLGLWQTRAPMENLIQGFLSRPTEYLLLGLMVALGVMFLTMEAVLSTINDLSSYVLLLAVLMGMLVLGLAFSTYMLMLMHLQQEHMYAQEKQQQFQEQYSTELARQMTQVQKFRHDYQNMLMGLGGYLDDQDYNSFRQLYVDIRSGWQTSNAADLTIEDLTNVPKIGVRYEIYHNYLLARQAGIQMYVVVPQPINATLEMLRQLGRVVDRTVPLIFSVVQAQRPPIMTLELKTTSREITYRLIFPVPEDSQLTGRYGLTGADFTVDFANVTKGVTLPMTLALRVKRHWAQLAVVLPRE